MGLFYAVLFSPLSDLLTLVSLNDVLCLLKLQAEKVPSGTQKCVLGLSHAGMEDPGEVAAAWAAKITVPPGGGLTAGSRIDWETPSYLQGQSERLHCHLDGLATLEG